MGQELRARAKKRGGGVRNAVASAKKRTPKNDNLIIALRSVNVYLELSRVHRIMGDVLSWLPERRRLA